MIKPNSIGNIILENSSGNGFEDDEDAAVLGVRSWGRLDMGSIWQG